MAAPDGGTAGLGRACALFAHRPVGRRGKRAALSGRPAGAGTRAAAAECGSAAGVLPAPRLGGPGQRGDHQLGRARKRPALPRPEAGGRRHPVRGRRQRGPGRRGPPALFRAYGAGGQHLPAGPALPARIFRRGIRRRLLGAPG